MDSYNQESLEQLNKKSLISIILSLQNKLETGGGIQANKGQNRGRP